MKKNIKIHIFFVFYVKKEEGMKNSRATGRGKTTREGSTRKTSRNLLSMRPVYARDCTRSMGDTISVNLTPNFSLTTTTSPRATSF